MSSKVHFCSTESQTFCWSILIADDSIECRCVNSGMTGQVGSFQNLGVCLQAFPSFLPHLLPALLLGHFLCGIWLSFLTLYSYSILSITQYFCLPCLTVRIECSFSHLHVLPGGRLQGTPWHLHNNVHASSRLKNDSFCQKRLPFSLPLG